MGGEFNFGDLYEAFGADVVSRGFAMFLLLLLIVLGTITMVNLFVVVIISDLSKLCPAACQGLKLDRAQDMLVVKEGIKAVMKRKGESKQVGDVSELPKTSKSTIMLSHISKRCA